MNYLFFSKLSSKYCCDANIVAMKCVHFESVILINNQLLSTANAQDFNTDYSCSDFRNEKKNGIFVLGLVFFFS